MATKQAAPKKANARKPRKSESTNTATDTDLQEGAIDTVVKKEPEVLVQGEIKGQKRVSVYAANVRRAHLTPGAKDDFSTEVTVHTPAFMPVDRKSVAEYAVAQVNAEKGLDLSLEAEQVTVKLVLVDIYPSE